MTRSGESRWVDTSISPIGEEDGAHYFVTTIRDITERIETLAELAEQGEQLQAAQSLARVGSWAWDVVGDVVSWSDELYLIYGLDRATFGASFEAYLARVHPEDRQLARVNVEQALSTHEPFDGAYRIVRADGEVRWLHSRGQVLLDEAGSVVRMIGTCQDVTDQRAAEDGLRHLALHDELTGLPTRTLLADRLEHAVSRAQRHGLATLVLFIDLDDFKAVNDRFGHLAGDEALQAVAHNLRDALRPGDTVARYGGDEFVALCEEVRDEDHALTLGRRVLEAVALAASATAVEGLRLTASVGVALSTNTEPGSLVRNADAAMYAAKRGGAGGLEIYR